jgi:hypothetical protein
VSSLVKATLQKIKSDKAETEDGDAFPVQFNPSSLKIKMTNQIEGGRSNAKQTRQQTGNSSRVLSLELIFDTADEGDGDTPVSVREKTKQLEQFVSASENNPDPPPKIKFHWGDLTVVGITESVDISLEHFAANGFPLRAKVSLSIKEQDPTIQFEPGNRSSDTAKKQGAEGTSPGLGTNSGLGGVFSDRSGLSLEGELGAEFAARVGLDPQAWRGLDIDLSAGLSLDAGIEVGFNVGLSASAGIGVSSGVNAQSSVTEQASAGVNSGQFVSSASSGANLSTSSSANNNNSQLSDPDAAGLAMSSLGGVGATIDAIKIQQSTQLTEQSVSAFAVNTPISTNVGGVDSSSLKAITRAPLAISGNRTYSQKQQAKAQPASVKVDKRAISYGLGVPLQALYEFSSDQQRKVYANRRRPESSQQNLAPSGDICTAPWESLPARDDIRSATDALEQQKSSLPCQSPCDCTGVNK